MCSVGNAPTQPHELRRRQRPNTTSGEHPFHPQHRERHLGGETPETMGGGQALQGNGLEPRVSNLRPRMAMNAAEHKTKNLLKML